MLKVFAVEIHDPQLFIVQGAGAGIYLVGTAQYFRGKAGGGEDTRVDDSLLKVLTISKRIKTLCVLAAMISYFEMVRLLPFYTCNCSQVHSVSYPWTAIEHVVKEGAAFALHERPVPPCLDLSLERRFRQMLLK